MTKQTKEFQEKFSNYIQNNQLLEGGNDLQELKHYILHISSFFMKLQTRYRQINIASKSI